jgi:hypothetical protein
MKLCTAIHAVVGVLLAAAAACSAIAQEPLRAAPLRTFDATQLPPDRYTVIKRLWVDSWRTAFDVPAHPESSTALAQLSDEAATLGADALINVVCLNDDRAWFQRGYFCYALAVRLK